MEKISFISLAVGPFWEDQPVLLAESLRAFGGPLAKAPLTFLTPADTSPLPEEVIEKLEAQNVKLIPIDIEDTALNFPLGLLPFAAAEAERLAVGVAEQLAWVLPDTLFITSPECFILPQGKQFAYRPVHHSNIGSDFNKPLDAYWSLIYKHCKVPVERIFPMETCTRDKILRPYINAGMLMTRPENGFMQAWMQAFQTAYQNKAFTSLLADRRNAIFLHQAVLSGVMMSAFTRHELHALPEAVNYPLHLHDDYPEAYKPASLNQLITCRYETIKDLQEGLEKISVDPPLEDWLKDKVVDQV